MKKLLLLAAITAASSNVQAGFFDSLFGKKEVAPTEKTLESSNAKTSAAPAVTEESSSMTEMALGLLPTLTQSLGVSDSQAEGGMGALLKMAQNNLSGEEFGTLSQGIPGIETMLSAAPALGGGSSAKGVGSALSALGGASGSLGALGEVTKQFEALGLSPEMVLKFAQMAIEYFSGDQSQTEGDVSGSDIGALLEKGLGAILG